MTKQICFCFFYFFMALLAIFLNFLRWNLPKFSQHIASCGIRILKTKKIGFVKAGFSIFANLRLLTLRENWSYRFRWKTSSDYSKTFTNNLPSFTEFRRRKREKIHCQFCLLCSCWCNKISKNSDVFLRARADYLSFRLQCACNRKTIGSHLNSKRRSGYLVAWSYLHYSQIKRSKLHVIAYLSIRQIFVKAAWFIQRSQKFSLHFFRQI